MSYNFSPLPSWQFSNGNGAPYAGGLLYTFETGSSTPKTTYDSSDTANSNPVVLDSEGRATVKLGIGQYRMVLTDGANATLFDPATIEGTTIWDISGIGSDVQAISVVESIADLQAIPAAGIAVGDAVIVQGYAAANDGGGGVFTWDSTSTSTDDAGVIVKPTDGTTGRWVRIFNGGVNPRWWGAVANGSTDDTVAVKAAKTYAVSNTCGVVLDYGTFYCATNPGFTTSNTTVTFNKAIIKWSGYALNINPIIPISDTSRHFSYSSGSDNPVFPATAEIKNIWLDGSTAGWLQTTLGLASDVTTLQTDVSNLKGANDDIIIIDDGAGTWVAGSLIVNVNDNSYTQAFDTNKNTSLTAMAAQIAADASVDSATYSSTTHQIVITPLSGCTLWVYLDATGITGGMSTSMYLEKRINASLSCTKRFKLKKGSVVTAANSMAVPTDGNFFEVTGATTINLISIVGWETGSTFSLWFDGSLPILKHNQAASGDYKPMYLLDAVDYTPEAGTVITFVWNGGYWIEVSRNTLRNPNFTTLTVSGASTLSDDLSISVAGKGLKVKEGSNATMGTASFSSEAYKVVSTTAVKSTSRIFLTANGATVTTLWITAITDATSFRIDSSAATWTGTAYWLIINPV